MKDAINKAMEGGYKPVYEYNCQYCDDVWPQSAPLNVEKALLDPLFWQSLGKALEWPQDWPQPYQTGNGNWIEITWAEYKHHEFIHHIHLGKDPNSFFESLLPKSK